eukprot:411116-Amorphochlora_amoeboformis.AAC.1
MLRCVLRRNALYRARYANLHPARQQERGRKEEKGGRSLRKRKRKWEFEKFMDDFVGFILLPFVRLSLGWAWEPSV